MRAVDTNVLVRLLARDDPHQLAAAESFVQAGAWISHLVLMEAVWVLDSVYAIKAPQLAAGLALLLDHQTLVIQDADVVASALAHFRAHPKLGFSDCLILSVALRAGHFPLGTFDRRLSKLPGTQKL
ncbi:MAG: type II toxin-antitoxin system VapC family toxin [Myxococcales bacterium]|jgi:predicted nucleic-acid-binding protein|nr:type II toxin-antitoxin system VapC family toxin [Myxococcales bacterium]MBL0194831.1 type II toxin-antitoxin system VapC family toxin [Myxococcales bacterium]HQY63491.1 type II toxin-antitoxin system VapC family toxin [Polyangiaceae bacterium]